MEGKIEHTKKGKFLRLVPHLPKERNRTIEVSLIESITGENVESMDGFLRKWYEHECGMTVERRDGRYRIHTASEQALSAEKGARLATRALVRGVGRSTAVDPEELTENEHSRLEHSLGVAHRLTAAALGAQKEIRSFGKLSGRKSRSLTG